MICHITEAASDRAFLFRKSQPWPSKKAMTKDVAHTLCLMGEGITLAKYDDGGNCILCGEAGRCPGVHATSEWQRVEAGIM